MGAASTSTSRSNMDELVCDTNQYEVPHGRLSCTAASMCCARLLLEKGGTGITKDDLHRALRAGGVLYHRWRKTVPSDALQCWADVTRAHPTLLDGYAAVYETNGFLPANGGPDAPLPQDADANPFVLGTVDDVLDAAAARGTRAGVLTAHHGSYAIGYERPFWYVFDPHGTACTSHATHVSPATLRRVRRREDFRRYLLTSVVPHAPARAATRAQFQAVLFAPQVDAAASAAEAAPPPTRRLDAP